MSIRDRINSVDDLNREPITLWGESLTVRELTLAELSLLNDADDEDLGTKSAMLVGMTLCDADGSRVWPELDDAALEEIKGKSFSVLRQVTEAANRINGLDLDEDAAGNSEDVPS